VDADQVATLRALLAPTGWLERTRVFARALRSSTKTPGGLLLVGTPEEEPWHLTAHLDEESRLSGIPVLTPTLVRWAPPADAPPHLRVGLERLEAARRGETLFVVTPTTAPVPLLERVSDARKVGATILALDQGDPELEALAHESLVVPGGTGPGERSGLAAEAGAVAASEAAAAAEAALPAPPSIGGSGQASGLVSFGAVQHLISAAAGDRDERRGRGVRGLRSRVARLLDAVSGPSA
jgi:hypothetical protein